MTVDFPAVVFIEITVEHLLLNHGQILSTVASTASFTRRCHGKP